MSDFISFGEVNPMKKPKLFFWSMIAVLIGVLAVLVHATPQQQISGGGATNLAQVNGVTTAVGNGTANTGTQRVTIASDNTAFNVNALGSLTDTQLRATPVPISGTVTASMGALVTGTANVGIVRTVPSSCTQSTPFSNSTVGVATGAGTTVTSTSTCVTLVYVNNITNSPVTFRLADKAGTPVVWIGGNADFTVQANSNYSFPLGGVVFTSGITAIAGTASAINLQVNGLQ